MPRTITIDTITARDLPTGEQQLSLRVSPRVVLYLSGRTIRREALRICAARFTGPTAEDRYLGSPAPINLPWGDDAPVTDIVRAALRRQADAAEAIRA